MGKFSAAGKTQSALMSDLERIAQAEANLPVEPQQEAAVEQAPVNPAAFQQTAQDPTINLATAEELPGQFEQLQQQDPQQQLEANLQEEQRQAIPNIRERWKNVPTPAPIQSATASADVDGGIINRANRMAKAVESGGITPPVSLRNTPGFEVAQQGGTGVEIADTIAQEKEGSIQGAIARIGAVNQTDPRNPQVDPDFVKAGSLVTENIIMGLAGGGADVDVQTEADPIAAALGQEPELTFSDEKKPIKRVAKQQANAQIGQDIALEYQRLKGNPNPEKIPPKEAETLGDAFKMMWAAQNKDLVNVTRDPETNQKYLELTPTGEDVLAKGQADRKRLFPTKNVRPAKTPIRGGQLPGDTGQNVVRKVQGGVGKQDFSPAIKDAMRNLANVPNVVDKQRMRILYATALPILAASNDPTAFDSWQAKINNIGSDKRAKYEVKSGPEGAAAEMQKAAFKLAQEVQSIATERNGANYLSYAVQGFQGRISPQQGKFNPTTSKAVRFVTRNAVPAPAKPGSRVEYNLRQMYAMMLVPGADAKLPDAREIAFDGFAPTIEKWAGRLEQALQMTDAEAETISQAIEQGVALTDPNFPVVKGLQLDPEQDAELISAIEKKGEDGPHFIDGIIDAAKYLKASRAKQTYHSYFNAYIDGKTNGIASNGIQMGISQTAKQTGVIRDSKEDYLDDPGDVRAVLNNTLIEMVDTNGFDGNVSEFSSELSAVAKAVFSHRDLNKKTTMTFGYGKEVETFGQDMYETAMLLKTDPSQIKNPEMRAEFIAAIPEVENRMPNSKDFGDTLMTIYGPALESVMSKEALATRAIMRGAAMMHAATNQLMSIKGPTGMDLNFGRDVRVAEGVEESSYRIRGGDIAGGEQEFFAQHQTSEPTSAAARRYTNEETGEVTEHAGDFAYGGSVVGPVQALDAATVALSSSGKSWNRMKQASGGNPYLHTIYDAFKADAMGYDVVLEEVNQNWLNTSMDWSYLEETQKAVKESMANWKQEMSNRDPKEKVSDNERAYMDYILQVHYSTNNKPYMKNFISKVGTAASFKGIGKDPFKEANSMAKAMQQVGYDFRDPPETATVQQLRTFVNILEGMLNTQTRLSKAIEHTNNNKKRLKQEILQKGYKTKSGRTIALQYYAH